MLMLITPIIAASQCFPCGRGAGSAGRRACHLQGGFFFFIIIICLMLNYPADSFKLCVFRHNCSSSVESAAAAVDAVIQTRLPAACLQIFGVCDGADLAEGLQTDGLHMDEDTLFSSCRLFFLLYI